MAHISLTRTRTHPLLAGNDTVPTSVWHGGCVHSTECRLVCYAEVERHEPGIGSSRTGFELKTTSRTNSDALEIGLEEAWSWPWLEA